jgi:xanthine dehydrogenase YagS FAD-binding subunit
VESFRYTQATSVDTALKSEAGQQGAKFIAGGTTLVDLMKLNVERPSALVDINPLPLAQIESVSDGGLKIGAMVRNSDLANHEVVRQRYTVLSEALLSGASPQLRNMATTGGICCSVRVATTSATPPTPRATSEAPARDVRRWMASTGFTRSWEPASTA